MGKLRDEAKWPDDVYYGGDHTYISNSEKLDCPQAPARILLDDIEQEMVTDMGLDLDEGLYIYKIEPYPESHHIDNPVDVGLMRLFGRTHHLQWDLNMKGGCMSNRVNCNSCPCKNNDCDYGISCNLGHDIKHDYFSDKNWYDYSDNCGLFCIETDGGPIYPIKLEPAMTNDIKYPEELKQDEILKNLERLEAKLKRREAEIKIMKEKDGDIKSDDKNRRR